MVSPNTIPLLLGFAIRRIAAAAFLRYVTQKNRLPSYLNLTDFIPEILRDLVCKHDIDFAKNLFKDHEPLCFQGIVFTNSSFLAFFQIYFKAS